MKSRRSCFYQHVIAFASFCTIWYQNEDIKTGHTLGLSKLVTAFFYFILLYPSLIIQKTRKALVKTAKSKRQFKNALFFLLATVEDVRHKIKDGFCSPIWHLWYHKL